MKPLLFTLLLAAAAALFGNSPPRTIAVTVDDLPVVSTRADIGSRRSITVNLLKRISDHRVAAIGFVNESKLYSNGVRDAAKVQLLQLWLDAGLELGNHTFSHRSLNVIDLEQYKDDILRGQIITGELLASKGRTIRFFRHPFLQTGLSREVKDRLRDFLQKHGYRIAPITFDNADYIFARGYDIACDRGDKALMKRIGDTYVGYMEQKVIYWERQSVKLFGREISQTLLIHANFINSEYFDDLAVMLKRRGYKFVDLQTALNDEAYSLPDNFMGRAGISWLHRWALDRGRDYILPDEPKVPDFIIKLTGMSE